MEVSIGSGAAVSSGLTVAFGEGFVVAVGLGFGFAVGEGDGDGDSSGVIGVLAWKGVEAASCARTKAAVAHNRIAKNKERIITVPRKLLRTLARVHPPGQEQYRQEAFLLKESCTREEIAVDAACTCH